MLFEMIAVAALLSTDWKVEIGDNRGWREVETRLLPFGAGLEVQERNTNAVFAAEFDGIDSTVRMARGALCELEWRKDLRVRVTRCADAAGLSVSPVRLGYGPYDGSSAELSFPKPAKLLVRADRDNVTGLSLIVSPKPSEQDETGYRRVIRFPAGYHDSTNDDRIGRDAFGAPVVTIAEDDTLVHLEKGARVCAAFDVRGGARNVRIVGPGTIDLMARLPYFDVGFVGEMPYGGIRRGVLPAIYIHENAEGVTIKDLTIIADFRGINIRNARGIVMDNVNMFTSVINADGVNVINTEDVLTVKCYIRSQDDAWCAYNNCDSIRWLWDEPRFCRTRRCRNLRCFDSFLMTNCRPIVIGGHGTNSGPAYDVMEDVEVAHCTLVEAKGSKADLKHQSYWSGMIRVLSQSEELVRDIRFRDIDAEWDVNFVGQPVHLEVRKPGNASYAERGGYAIRDVLFEDVRFVDAPVRLPLPPFFSAPERGPEGFGIRNVTFRDVVVNGCGFGGLKPMVSGEVKGLRYE